jgi:biopolymer transport protein ExbD
MNFRRGRHREEPEINFIPLIDVLMVILIFLMVTTTYSKFTELQVNLPPLVNTRLTILLSPRQMPIALRWRCKTLQKKPILKSQSLPSALMLVRSTKLSLTSWKPRVWQVTPRCLLRRRLRPRSKK